MTLKPIALIAAALALSGCVATTNAVLDSAGTQSDPTPTTTVSSSTGTAIGTALNAARSQNGLSVVQPNAALMAAAQEQARYMAATSNLTHTGSGGSSVGQRVRRAGCSYSWVGENVAVGQPTAQATMDAWMNSAGHRRNALNRSATTYGSATVGGYSALVLAGGC